MPVFSEIKKKQIQGPNISTLPLNKIQDWQHKKKKNPKAYKQSIMKYINLTEKDLFKGAEDQSEQSFQSVTENVFLLMSMERLFHQCNNWQVSTSAFIKM